MDIIRSVVAGIFSFFINPLLYFLIIAQCVYSAQRVRRERISFHVKAYGMFNTIFASIGPSLLAGLGTSLILLAAGVALSQGVLVLLTLAYVAVLLTCRLRFLSPAIAGGLTLIAAALLPVLHTPWQQINRWSEEIHTLDYLSFGVFLVVCLLAETLLIFARGAYQTSPRLITGNRGQLVGAHEACQLWLVPVLVLVPGPGALHAFGSWPLVSGDSSFSLAFFPIGIGLAQLITHALPQEAVRRTAFGMLLTAVATAVIVAAAGYFHLPILVVIAGGTALAGRLLILWHHHYLRAARPFYYVMPNRGLRVVGAIPHSLGARMGILPGEEILRVNNLEISGVDDFYAALQKHAAYCKIEVIDHSGEQRFVKGSIHETDDYRIGLLFLEGDRWSQQSM